MKEQDTLNTRIDVIVLSYAKTPDLRLVTENCLQSLIASERGAGIEFDAIVIESKKDAPPYSGKGVRTLYPETPFGYHAYMNIGIRQSGSPYVCLCNNDLHFHPGWASAMLRAFTAHPELQSASPLCTRHHPGIGIAPGTQVLFGYEVRREIAGWCLFFRRSMLDITGPLDETFRFWFADNDYARTLEKHGLPHAMVTSSWVDHLESRTLEAEGAFRRQLLTSRAKIEFNRKWHGLRGFTYWRKVAQCNLKLAKCYLKERLLRRAST